MSAPGLGPVKTLTALNQFLGLAQEQTADGVSLCACRSLDKFKNQLAASGEDLQTWRDDCGKDYDWSLLDRNGGKGWDLAKQLVRPRNILQRGRMSAADAMRHSYFWPEF